MTGIVAKVELWLRSAPDRRRGPKQTSPGQRCPSYLPNWDCNLHVKIDADSRPAALATVGELV